MSLIDDYIDGFEGEPAERMRTILAILREEMPGADEKIAYDLPTFKWNGKNCVYFGGFKHHIGFYPTSEPIEQFAADLKGYKTSRGAIQFQNNEPLPTDLIRRIVARRVAALTPPE